MPSRRRSSTALSTYSTTFDGGRQDCNADDNFWRSHVEPDPQRGPAGRAAGLRAAPCSTCTAPGATTARRSGRSPRQTPIRRAIINGSVVFQDYCGAQNDYASGGFIADSQISGRPELLRQPAVPDAQQLHRRRQRARALWNMVYSGVQGAPAAVLQRAGLAEHGARHQPGDRGGAVPLHGRERQSTTCSCPRCRQTRPAPRGPAAPRRASRCRCRRSSSPTRARRSRRSTSRSRQGKNLVLTPGRLQPVRADRRHAGRARWCSVSASPRSSRSAATPPWSCCRTPGVQGLRPDRRRRARSTRRCWSRSAPRCRRRPRPPTPTLIYDVFFRIGGAETTATSATVSLLDNASHSIIDDVWAWRADHGDDVGLDREQGRHRRSW